MGHINSSFTAAQLKVCHEQFEEFHVPLTGQFVSAPGKTVHVFIKIIRMVQRTACIWVCGSVSAQHTSLLPELIQGMVQIQLLFPEVNPIASAVECSWFRLLGKALTLS